jgi:2,5-diketo-D-gluconate reductase A
LSRGALAESKNDIFTNRTLTAIGDAHGKSVAQVVLRWLVEREVVVIPKSVRPERMAENINIFDFHISDAEMNEITTLDTGVSVAFDHHEPTMVSWLNSRAE